MSNVQARPGYFAKCPLHPALAFSFTPMDYLEREKTDRARRDAHDNPEKLAALVFATIKTHLTTWQANQSHTFGHIAGSSDGDALPLTTASIRLLKPPLTDKLFLLVMGSMASDPSPGATEEESEDYAAMLLKAAEEGITPGSSNEALDKGN